MKWNEWTNRLDETIAIGDLVLLGPDRKEPREVRATPLGELLLINLFAPPQAVHHDAASATAENDSWLITVHDYGRSRISQDGVSADLTPHDIVFRRTSLASDVRSETSIRQVILKVPNRTVARSRLTWADGPTIVRARSGLAGATAAFILKLADEIDFLPAQVRGTTADTILQLLSTCVSDHLVLSGQDPHTSRAEQYFNRACILVQARLKDPELNARVLGDELGISARYLQRIFAKAGMSVNRFIWDQRLARSRLDLMNPALSHQSITQICHRWGFSDSAHFSRAFRQRFSVRPSDLRKLQATGPSKALAER